MKFWKAADHAEPLPADATGALVRFARQADGNFAPGFMPG